MFCIAALYALINMFLSNGYRSRQVCSVFYLFKRETNWTELCIVRLDEYVPFRWLSFPSSIFWFCLFKRKTNWTELENARAHQNLSFVDHKNITNIYSPLLLYSLNFQFGVYGFDVSRLEMILFSKLIIYLRFDCVIQLLSNYCSYIFVWIATNPFIRVRSWG